MNGLVVTADDFGLATEVNDAVEAAHRRGILSAASLMVGAPAAADAVARARAMPRLGIGLHLVLVEGRPSLPPEAVPDLVGENGQFRTDMARTGLDIALKPRVRRQLAAEIEAQFAAFAATGLRLDHVNAHKHFHLHPVIGGLVLAIGRRYGMTALRVPREPTAIVDRIGPVDPSRAERMVAAPWAALLAARARRAGMRVPDAVFGLAWSGAFTANRLAALLGGLPDGLIEIYLHPATADRFAGSAPGYRYRDEFAALMDPAVLAAIGGAGHCLAGYAEHLAAAGNDPAAVALVAEGPGG
ncbi:MAG TPA: hopanoid biosynthesis-associated protein HpnK [Hyphomicrobiales bacterium]|nr:hopanoid biosynthesis-associated protein HpnK [Hyphomicrobiales bacterium]